MRTQLASPAESGTTIILRRLCISPVEAHKPYAREVHHICNKNVACESASSEVLYENEDLYEDGDCMRICIRTRVMRLMSDRAYAYTYGILYIYGLWLSR
jgi:hypothetical protein